MPILTRLKQVIFNLTSFIVDNFAKNILINNIRYVVLLDQNKGGFNKKFIYRQQKV